MGATVVVQARMTSRRLPGKVMMEVAGRPLLALLLTRLRHARRVGTIVLATTRLTSDDPLAALAADLDVPLVRGDEDDVLGRFAAAAALAPSPVMVRVTGDCPLLDPAILDAHLAVFGSGRLYDYVWCGDRPTLPNGMICEVFTRAALAAGARVATTAYDREHVTPYLRRHTPPARVGVYHLARDLSGHRLCVDTAEDFALVERVLTALAPVGDCFTLNDVIACLADHPDWRALNAEVPQATGPFRR